MVYYAGLELGMFAIVRKIFVMFENSKKRRIVFAVILAFLSTTAVSLTGAYVRNDSFFGMLRAEVDGLNISSLIVFGALSFLYAKARTALKHIRHWSVPILAALFSVFMLIGLSFTKNGNLYFIIGDKKQYLIALLCFAGYFVLFGTVVKGLYFLLDKAASREPQALGAPNRFLTFIQTHAFWSAFIIIFLFWLPYFIVFSPCSITFDGMFMLIQGLRGCPLSDNHGWLLPLIMGRVFRIGQQVSDNFGAFQLLATFATFELLCFSTVCKIISRWKIPSWVTFSIILFFSICPYFGGYAQAILKDTLFMAAFVFYMALYIDICLSCWNRGVTRDSKKNILWELASLLCVGIVLCVVRHNGSYLVLLATLLLLGLIRKGCRRYVVVLFVCVSSFLFLYNKVLPPLAGVTPSNVGKRVRLSLAFQITGRYMREYANDLTVEDVQTLKKTFTGKYHGKTIKDVSGLGKIYNPGLSDPVKCLFNNNLLRDEMRDYLRVVASMVKKHPLVCLEAVLHHTYGYYYPFNNMNVHDSFQFNISGAKHFITGALKAPKICYEMPSSVRNGFNNYAELWKKLPVLSVLINPAFPTWGCFLLVGYLTYRKKWRAVLPFAVPLLGMVICVLSPVNGHLRYSVPYLASMPVFAIWTVLAARLEMKDLSESEEK